MYIYKPAKIHMLTLYKKNYIQVKVLLIFKDLHATPILFISLLRDMHAPPCVRAHVLSAP